MYNPDGGEALGSVISVFATTMLIRTYTILIKIMSYLFLS